MYVSGQYLAPNENTVKQIMSVLLSDSVAKIQNILICYESYQVIFSECEPETLKNNIVCFCELLQWMNEGILVILSGEYLPLFPNLIGWKTEQIDIHFILR